MFLFKVRLLGLPFQFDFRTRSEKEKLTFLFLLFLASTTQQRPLIAADHRPSTGVSSTGIQVLQNVVVQPPVLNPIVGTASVTGHNDTVYTMANDYQMDAPFWNGMNIITEANQMLNGKCRRFFFRFEFYDSSNF